MENIGCSIWKKGKMVMIVFLDDEWMDIDGYIMYVVGY